MNYTILAMQLIAQVVMPSALFSFVILMLLRLARSQWRMEGYMQAYREIDKARRKAWANSQIKIDIGTGAQARGEMERWIGKTFPRDPDDNH